MTFKFGNPKYYKGVFLEIWKIYGGGRRRYGLQQSVCVYIYSRIYKFLFILIICTLYTPESKFHGINFITDLFF